MITFIHTVDVALILICVVLLFVAGHYMTSEHGWPVAKWGAFTVLFAAIGIAGSLWSLGVIGG